MSLEDDTDSAEIELRDLVTQTLEENGVLSKIRAQLRAGLYLALENDINTGYQTFYHNSLKAKLENPDIKTIFCLVREFLEYFELSFTCSIFEKESLLGTNYSYENREKLIQDLDIGIDTLHNKPLLSEVLNIARSSFNISTREENNKKINSTNENINTTYELTAQNKSEVEYSSSNASSEISQHVIDVKTVLKERDIEQENKENLETNRVNGNSDIETVYSDSNKNTSQSDDTNSKRVQSTKTNETEDKLEADDQCLVNTNTADDTYEGTSSIAEDSSREPLYSIDSNHSTPKNSTNDPIDPSKSPKLSPSPDSEKRKHEKAEKLKPMSGLTSLNDLPPLQVNKIRNTDTTTALLPSLYSKEFREKSSLKDIDKLLEFDSLDNYEEDFMSSGSVADEEADLKRVFSQKNKQDTSKQKRTNNKDLTKDTNRNFSQDLDNHVNQQDGDTKSDDFDINSNIDDLLS